MMTTKRRLLTAALAAALVVSSCASDPTTVSPASTSSSTSTTAQSATTLTTTTSLPTAGFNGHTTERLESVADYDAFARSGATNQSVVKFSIPDILNTETVHWMDSTFYDFHDEWYWFHLLNGVAIAGSPTEPIDGAGFSTIGQIYAFAEGLPSGAFPLDLELLADSRLYSREFYRLAIDEEPRVFGVGSLVRYADEDDPTSTTHWLLELEYTDDVRPDEIELFFDRLIPTLPDEIGSALKWVVRSPHQEEIGEQMIAESLPYSDRVVRYADIVPQGEVSVYNPGIAAGRLLYVGDGGAQLTDAEDTDIVIMQHVPDELPPASALITSAPQTPLAHVNLLARNRGIPNASQAGVIDDAQIRQAARVRAPAIVRASGTGDLEIVLITQAEFNEWKRLGGSSEISVPPVDLDSLLLIVSLDQIAEDIQDETQIDQWRPIIGGKSAGFLTLLAAPDVTTPDRPLAITVRPYAEHLDSVGEALDALLNNREFRREGRARYLLLEGPDSYAEEYLTDDDVEFFTSFSEDHPPGSEIGDVLEAGGFMDYFRDVPIDEITLDEITTTLETHFGAYATTQGLRFRSSSSVEDIEGFSGAGLYDSNTGFLEASRQPDEGDHKRTVERAIKKTWASYWSFVAFEERRREAVDHQSGAMGILVHARFDDPLEINNGVATFTLLPENAGAVAIATINAQIGAESVTNPDPTSGDLPEAVEVRIDRSGVVVTTMRTASTLSPTEAILNHRAIRELMTQLEAVTVLWRDRVNATLAPAKRIETLTLDFEFKTMAEGWPATSAGEQAPSRLIVKQARPLDPSLRNVPTSVRDLPVGRDILARARSVVAVSCGGIDHIEILTDALLSPDVGYSESPLIVGEPAASQVACRRTVLYSTPDQFLLELLENV